MIEKANIAWPGWETCQLLGRGSFGAVYKIQKDILGSIEEAALKVISIPQDENDIEEMYSDGYDEESITSTLQSHLKSIVAEYTLMGKMKGSANIVNCDDLRYVPHSDGIGWDVFIKMELLTPLTKALPSQISEETILKVAKDMCFALELCRKHNIVHRDIKPQNIFVSPNGDYKLGDFGIAKTVEKTMGGTKIGTYKYMAPEVYNNQPYGTATDIYSLGLVLYWMLNERRMPFLPLPPEKLKAGMEEEARNRRLAGEPLPPPAHGSEKLKQIVLKACAFSPKDRYLTAEAMLRALNSIDDSVSAAPVPYLEKLPYEQTVNTPSVPESEKPEYAAEQAHVQAHSQKELPELEFHHTAQNEEQSTATRLAEIERIEREQLAWERQQKKLAKLERIRQEQEEEQRIAKRLAEIERVEREQLAWERQQKKLAKLERMRQEQEEEQRIVKRLAEIERVEREQLAWEQQQKELANQTR